MDVLFFSFLVCLLLLVSSVPSECNPKPVIFNFGDSNSDTGNFFIIRGMLSQLPQNFSLPVQDRLCNGRLVLDFLCESLNARHLSPFMESVGSNFTNGVNFALAGSSAFPRSTPFSLAVQVAQFARFKSRSLQFFSPGIEGLLGEEDFANGVYVIDMGQNDLDTAFASHSYAQVVERIPSLIAEFENAMWRLYLLGARKFWVHSTGPLGCLPLILSRRNYSAGDLDRHGCSRAVNRAALEFNDQLSRLCRQLRRRMKEVTAVVYVDVFAIKYDLIANSSKYGFEEDPMRVCCGHGGGRYNFNATSQCGSQDFQVCDRMSEYVNWDGTHYTEAANKFVATKILSTVYSTPRLALADLFLPGYVAPESVS
ncbi:PREDICTED: GDSL esterase/lipase At1g09390-like [Ipomoea nil]|uniref:GDSL esterase/lipase At1g09390-like n=1 Tax=Ipomoea nil TaxID=35883 RepID=UPI0009011442|nr:PREDICTED: GDSL esterase/lipase At1g09390-like [Ipomoea nil]